MDIARAIYPVLELFPKSESFVLTQQMRRCAISIPSNIAEGSAKSSNKDFKRFLEIALGSSFELETQLILAKDFKYIDLKEFEYLIDTINELQKMICGFKNSLS